ncbi:universal stress protein [Salinigranum marinum]|uniref:universal stress protein n=1 Tax=Salinigranum marinum TaxID=1515595 RepID=UPI0029899FF9|nr:universal stress protein [Salinigranum marinum]
MKVLLGIGGTDDSLAALEQTVDRAVEAGDDLTIGVVDNPATELSREEVESRVRTVVDEAELDAEVRHLDGDPGSALVRLSEEEGFDKIVIGGGQRSPMGKIKIGGIAEFVLLNAHVTVSLVR